MNKSSENKDKNSIHSIHLDDDRYNKLCELLDNYEKPKKKGKFLRKLFINKITITLLIFLSLITIVTIINLLLSNLFILEFCIYLFIIVPLIIFILFVVSKDKKKIKKLKK